MLPFVLMAQLNSEKSSQGHHSLQYFGSATKANQAAIRLCIRQFQLHSMNDSHVFATGDGAVCQEFEKLSDRSARQAYVSMNDDGSCEAAFVARASDMPLRGVLGV